MTSDVLTGNMLIHSSAIRVEILVHLEVRVDWTVVVDLVHDRQLRSGNVVSGMSVIEIAGAVAAGTDIGRMYEIAVPSLAARAARVEVALISDNSKIIEFKVN